MSKRLYRSLPAVEAVADPLMRAILIGIRENLYQIYSALQVASNGASSTSTTAVARSAGSNLTAKRKLAVEYACDIDDDIALDAAGHPVLCIAED